MRIMSILKANADSEADVYPTLEEIERMGALIGEMQAAGVLIDTGGLRSSRDGKRVSYQDGKRTITDGPFAETKECVAGFYLIDAKDMDEAIQAASKIPPARVGSVEVRPVRELRT